ncbi:putative nuclease HARBI1 isoform X1 [Scaptodrosophila lebanonensis]|uniref:Nuclease HARBI1 isoform X1 n=2 Tax=Drosophila lebanonensis TaxID=7225 RepID=A0A6J2TCM2_DROLE|nr:putative nuclease HARBI1 isoform X1 [Scaptodrosophila lebanonensis]
MDDELNKSILMLCFGAAAMQALLEEESRKPRRLWRRRERHEEERFYEMVFKELRIEKPRLKEHFWLMNATTFEHLLGLVGPLITKKDTLMRSAISAKCRLMLTLRYLATGEKFRALQRTFRVPHTTISKLVPEVCAALYRVLKDDYIKFPSDESEWKQISDGFNTILNFPNCIGAIDGRHVVMVAPASTERIYHNYKRLFSIVLIGVVDANYKFIYIDVDSNGKAPADGIFQHTPLSEGLLANNYKLPMDAPLPLRQLPMPFLMVGGDALPLNRRVLKRYLQTDLCPMEEVFNYRLSRAYSSIENAFGVLSYKFSVLNSPIALNPEKTRLVTLACCALHNYLLEMAPNYITRATVDRYESNGLLIPGKWHKSTESKTFHALEPHTAFLDEGVKDIQDEFIEYFIEEGDLHYQYNHI